MRKNKVLKIIGIATIVVALLSGLFLIGVDLIKNQVRQQIKISAIEAVESVIDDGGGEVVIEIPITDFLKVNGEGGEDDTTIRDLLNEMGDISAEHEQLYGAALRNTICKSSAHVRNGSSPCAGDLYQFHR